jgi:hypothetical protein
MSIIRITTGTASGQYHNDTNDTMSAWDQDLSDGDIDFWCDLRVTSTGAINNTPPSVVSNPVPSDTSDITDLTPKLEWDEASDSDSGDAVTSYFIELATHTNWSGDMKWRVNVDTDNFTVPTNLANLTTFYWHVYSRDMTGVFSADPATWYFYTESGDGTDPAAITTLSALASSGGGQIRLWWSAPGDDGWSGTATSYDIRFSTMESESPATSESNFTDADSLAPYCMGGVPAPLVSGTTQFVVLSGLIPETTYYFAVKAADEASNWSGLSNGATVPAGIYWAYDAPLDAYSGADYTYKLSWGDYDNDGDLDLAAANNNNQTNYIYRNNGAKDFTDIGASLDAYDGTDETIGISWGDYDNDGDLDLVTANWSQKDYI